MITKYYPQKYELCGDHIIAIFNLNRNYISELYNLKQQEKIYGELDHYTYNMKYVSHTVEILNDSLFDIYFVAKLKIIETWYGIQLKKFRIEDIIPTLYYIENDGNTKININVDLKNKNIKIKKIGEK